MYFGLKFNWLFIVRQGIFIIYSNYQLPNLLFCVKRALFILRKFTFWIFSCFIFLNIIFFFIRFLRTRFFFLLFWTLYWINFYFFYILCIVLLLQTNMHYWRQLISISFNIIFRSMVILLGCFLCEILVLLRIIKRFWYNVLNSFLLV